ncbi:MAG: aldehyde ferredoxin oxidoreductase C-terminal domain-containing protein, partial [Calditrichales bacterium]|nr:aldehyde ferredoxin oxidoreductase C-terminal domain-containing protein [Calditrichales bacterium]
NLEKMFNYREGFSREDDKLPDRFFEESPTTGVTKGKVVKREEFDEVVNKYYSERGWDVETSKPAKLKLESLGLAFTL